jgi:hypothetical protein
MTASAPPTDRADGRDGAGGPAGRPSRPLVITGAIAACAAAGSGLVFITLLVLAGWIAAPHAGVGLPGVLRTAADLWLVGHHVGFALHGTGRIGMLPLGLVLLPGALLWMAGRWVVRRGQVTRLADVGYAALALAVPYGLVAGALALAGQSALATPSLLQAVLSGFLIALVAGGLGGARALAPWRRLIELLPPRARAVFVGTVGTLSVLTGAGAILAGASLATHMADFRSVDVALAPGLVGGGLLLLAQLAYIPNAIVWSICYTLGPGFAFGTGTVVAPTGSALGPLPMLPMLAALPSGGAHPGGRAGAAVGLRLRRGHRLRPGGARGVRGRPAGQRQADRGRAVRVAGRGGVRARGRGGCRGDHRPGELGPDPPSGGGRGRPSRRRARRRHGR